MVILQRVMAIILVFVATGAIPAAADEKPQYPPPARIVTALAVKQKVAETTNIVGTFYFDRVSRISAEVSGLVEQIHFREEDYVKKGDPMIRLNTDFVSNEIESVKASMDQVRVRMASSEKDLNPYKTLLQQNKVSEKEFDDMVLSRDDLTKQLLILEKQLELAWLKEKKSIIRAPFNGVVLEKNTDVGSWVAPDSGLSLLGSEDDLFIKAPISENLFRFASRGAIVTVNAKALNREFTGILDSALPKADPRTRTIFVKIRMPHIEEALLNMSATVFAQHVCHSIFAGGDKKGDDPGAQECPGQLQ